MDQIISKNNALTGKAFEEELIQNILPFWMTKMVDDKHGGFYGRIDGLNMLHERAHKGIILNARILWTFSAAHLQTANRDYLKAAIRAYDYFIHHFMDESDGGVYWMLNYKGEAINTRKQIYAQAFAIYALSEYYKVTKQQEVLDQAIALFRLIETYSFDSQSNGYLEAFDQEWRLLLDLRLSEKDANEAKTMNTHLHILEAYTNLYQVWPDELLRRRLNNLIELFRDRFISNAFHFHLFFDEFWNLKSDSFSFGHDIEGSWLLAEAAHTLGDEILIKEIDELAIQMVEASLEGMDQDGGLMNEAGPFGLEDSDKHWWPQAEALVGLVNAWQITGNAKYLDHAGQTWTFIKNKIVDRTYGEWHWRVTKEGEVIHSEDKAGPWKCPYHNGRAMLELMKRLPKS